MIFALVGVLVAIGLGCFVYAAHEIGEDFAEQRKKRKKRKKRRA